MTTKNQLDLYKAARQRLNAARLRGDDADAFEEATCVALLSMMSADDRRILEEDELRLPLAA